jgi:mycothiol synthase
VFQSRMYTEPADFDLLRAVCRATVPRHWPRMLAALGDLEYWAATDTAPHELPQTRIWFAGATPVAWVWPTNEGADLLIRPDYWDVAPAVIGWAAQLPHSGEQPHELYCYQGDAAYAALLRANGYRFKAEHIAQRVRTLAQLPAAPVLPVGYQVRGMREEDIASRVPVHHDAFGNLKMNAARYARLMRGPIYRADLDLVAEAPDGSIAAFATFWYDEDNRSANIEPVGCHAAHRRRGLARALMVEGMRRVAALGGTRISLFSSADTSAAGPHLYESLGMPVAGITATWVRI